MDIDNMEKELPQRKEWVKDSEESVSIKYMEHEERLKKFNEIVGYPNVNWHYKVRFSGEFIDFSDFIIIEKGHFEVMKDDFKRRV